MHASCFTIKDSHNPLKLMAVLAHPDDESLATGGMLAKYITYYRAMSLVNGGREVEDDLFTGLRRSTQSYQTLFYNLPQLPAA